MATKARLDSIAVKGDCECGDAPPPAEPSVDIIVCVDGSDSYNSKAELKVGTVEGGTFAGTVEALQQYLFPAIAEKLGGKNNVGLIQFSGIKQLEGAYVPGNDGEVNGMQHWQWEIEPTELTNKNCYFKQLNEAGWILKSETRRLSPYLRYPRRKRAALPLSPRFDLEKRDEQK